jgi:hypothetical protein
MSNRFSFRKSHKLFLPSLLRLLTLLPLFLHIIEDTSQWHTLTLHIVIITFKPSIGFIFVDHKLLTIILFHIFNHFELFNSFLQLSQGPVVNVQRINLLFISFKFFEHYTKGFLVVAFISHFINQKLLFGQFVDVVGVIVASTGISLGLVAVVAVVAVL